MPVQLRAFGRAFATRERADEIVPTVVTGQDEQLELDFEGVTCTTSFLIQLLTSAAALVPAITVIGVDDALASKIERLVERFGIGTVNVRRVASIA